MQLTTIDESARFHFVRTLGEGASGRVYEVEDRVHGGRSALKRLRHDRPADADRIARFKDEFRALERLAHPNVARVYELLADAAEFSVLMELVEGVDFVQYVHPGAVGTPPVPTASDDDEDLAPPSR